MKTALIQKINLNFASRAIALFSAMAALAFTATPAARADGSKVNVLVNFEVSDKYLTPRGMIVADHGLTYQQLLLAFVDLYKSDGFISDVTFIPGVWADFTSHPIPIHVKGKGAADWVETDPIAGLSTKFAKDFKLDLTYTAFDMHILDIGTSQHFSAQLSYDDSSILKDFALHPYVLFWQELDGKATAAANFNVPSSNYFDVGIDPSATIASWKIEAPLRMLLPNTNFYGTHFAKHSTVGLYELGLKASTNMGFMPAGYGSWSFHIGVKYMKFVDKNLQHLAISGGFGNPKSDTFQTYAGLSTFF
ncbi:MAG TPA: hypothetical protein VNW30_04420 [Opitutaceae bacterium]|jgi:hypothetical protein|nr:hypothetical protein [Opitutaceae bacterium]